MSKLFMDTAWLLGNVDTKRDVSDFQKKGVFSQKTQR